MAEINSRKRFNMVLDYLLGVFRAKTNRWRKSLEHFSVKQYFNTFSGSKRLP
jgi:hypothetical protein